MVHALQCSPDVNGELDSILNQAVSIAREAGVLLMEGWKSSPETRAKRSRKDLVTEYDERSEEIIRARLSAAFPGISIVGEEAGGERRGASAWYVDPIDGTTNFAHGHPFFCVSIGLWEGPTAIAGVVHAPAMQLTYAASRGRGTTRNGAPCRVSRTADLEDALIGAGPPFRRKRTRALDRISHGLRRSGAAALEIALVADGGLDGFFDRGLKAWDLAAASLCVLEAGGAATDLDGRPVSVDVQAGIIASNGLIHPALCAALT